ncbi:MAG: hypothetical protein ACP5JG_19335 [Anaerolineae bacterium]
MNSLSQNQKIVLIVLAVLDFVVIGGLGAVVLVSSLRAARPAPTTVVATVTNTLPSTWTPAPEVSATPRPTIPPRPTNTAAPTGTPLPTATPTATSTPRPAGPVSINGADFDFLLTNRIPGWDWDAYVNYRNGDDYDSETSYAEPMFTAADDPVRQINGNTLKIETIRWLKFRTWVHQTVTVTAGSTAYFEIKAKAYSSLDSLIVKAGIDPAGAENCYNARWGNEMRINQDSGTVTLRSPRVTVLPWETSAPQEGPQETEGTEETPEAEEEAGSEPQGRVTLCFFAEPAYPHINNAAFFDQAELTVRPPQ